MGVYSDVSYLSFDGKYQVGAFKHNLFREVIQNCCILGFSVRGNSMPKTIDLFVEQAKVCKLVIFDPENLESESGIVDKVIDVLRSFHKMGIEAFVVSRDTLGYREKIISELNELYEGSVARTRYYLLGDQSEGQTPVLKRLDSQLRLLFENADDDATRNI